MSSQRIRFNARECSFVKVKANFVTLFVHCALVRIEESVRRVYDHCLWTLLLFMPRLLPAFSSLSSSGQMLLRLSSEFRASNSGIAFTAPGNFVAVDLCGALSSLLCFAAFPELRKCIVPDLH